MSGRRHYNRLARNRAHHQRGASTTTTLFRGPRSFPRYLAAGLGCRRTARLGCCRLAGARRLLVGCGDREGLGDRWRRRGTTTATAAIPTAAADIAVARRRQPLAAKHAHHGDGGATPHATTRTPSMPPRSQRCACGRPRVRRCGGHAARNRSRVGCGSQAAGRDTRHELVG